MSGFWGKGSRSVGHSRLERPVTAYRFQQGWVPRSQSRHRPRTPFPKEPNALLNPVNGTHSPPGSQSLTAPSNASIPPRDGTEFPPALDRREPGFSYWSVSFGPSIEPEFSLKTWSKSNACVSPYPYTCPGIWAVCFCHANSATLSGAFSRFCPHRYRLTRVRGVSSHERTTGQAIYPILPLEWTGPLASWQSKFCRLFKYWPAASVGGFKRFRRGCQSLFHLQATLLFFSIGIRHDQP